MAVEVAFVPFTGAGEDAGERVAVAVEVEVPVDVAFVPLSAAGEGEGDGLAGAGDGEGEAVAFVPFVPLACRRRSAAKKSADSAEGSAAVGASKRTTFDFSAMSSSNRL